MPQLTLEYTTNIATDWDYRYFLHQLHEIIINTIDTKIERCKSRVVQHDQFYVGDHARGKGVAQFMMDFAVQHIAEAGHKMAWLACASGNHRAERFYEKTGWTNTGEREMTFEATQGPFPLKVWVFERALD